MSTENKDKPGKDQDKGTQKGGGCGCGHGGCGSK